MSDPAKALGHETIINNDHVCRCSKSGNHCWHVYVFKKILGLLVVSRKHVLSSEKFLKKPQGPRFSNK